MRRIGPWSRFLSQSFFIRIGRTLMTCSSICSDFHFHTVRVFKIHSIISRTSSIGMLVLIENLHSSLSELKSQFIHIGFTASMEGKMVQPCSGAVIWDGKVLLRCLYKDQIGFIQFITDALGPGLIFLIAKFLKEPAPKFLAHL